MAYIIGAKTDVIPGVWTIIKLHPITEVIDGGMIVLLFYNSTLRSFDISQAFFTQIIEPGTIMSINSCNIDEHVVRENVFPIGRCGKITPLQIELVYIGRFWVKQIFFMSELKKVIP